MIETLKIWKILENQINQIKNLKKSKIEGVGSFEYQKKIFKGKKSEIKIKIKNKNK